MRFPHLNSHTESILNCRLVSVLYGAGFSGIETNFMRNVTKSLDSSPRFKSPATNLILIFALHQAPTNQCSTYVLSQLLCPEFCWVKDPSLKIIDSLADRDHSNFTIFLPNFTFDPEIPTQALRICSRAATEKRENMCILLARDDRFGSIANIDFAIKPTDLMGGKLGLIIPHLKAHGFIIAII